MNLRVKFVFLLVLVSCTADAQSTQGTIKIIKTSENDNFIGALEFVKFTLAPKPGKRRSSSKRRNPVWAKDTTASGGKVPFRRLRQIYPVCLHIDDSVSSVYYHFRDKLNGFRDHPGKGILEVSVLKPNVSAKVVYSFSRIGNTRRYILHFEFEGRKGMVLYKPKDDKHPKHISHAYF